ncbi:MAG: nitrite/sulfite reductase, partial [Armatimonadetes bacterium]|nr:nitrite/sulfite reductase [Armatimonadota bacterium]
IARFYTGNREYGNLPRKHKYTIAACPYHCNGPEIHDIALIGVVQDGEPGFALQVGGGLSSVPRIGKNLGVFVPRAAALEVARGLTTLWSQDLRYRISRARARFKFMVEDDGPELLREKLEAHLGRALPDLREFPIPIGRTDHLGVQPQRAAGGDPARIMIGFPCFPGLVTGEQMVRLSQVIPPDGEIRITREQNFLITHLPAEAADATIGTVAEIGFPLHVNPIRGHSIACTGDPHCNFALGDTKPDLVQIVSRLEERFGERAADLRLYLDGCPHACGQHWVGDLGFQGTTRNTETGKVAAYDIILRGKLGPGAEIGRPLLRRIPYETVAGCVERLVEAWLAERSGDEGLPEFYRRQPDERVLALAATGG